MWQWHFDPQLFWLSICNNLHMIMLVFHSSTTLHLVQCILTLLSYQELPLLDHHQYLQSKTSVCTDTKFIHLIHFQCIAISLKRVWKGDSNGANIINIESCSRLNEVIEVQMAYRKFFCPSLCVTTRLVHVPQVTASPWNSLWRLYIWNIACTRLD